jgi:hypothetical protein
VWTQQVTECKKKKKNQWYNKKDTPPSPKEEGLEKT